MYNIVVMTPSNSFHQLIHVVLDLQPSVLHVSHCLERCNESVSGRKTTGKVWRWLMHLYWGQAALRVFQDFKQVLFDVLKHKVLQENKGG